MPSAEVCTAAMNSPSRSRPTIPRLLFFLPRAIAMRVPCKPRYRPLLAAALTVEEGVGVEVDQLGTGDERDQSAESEKRAERHRLLAGSEAVADHDHRADGRAEEEPDQHSRRDGQSETQPHDSGQLHVAHAHAAGL